ncbi:hypothetical protein Q1695_016110 [Nippostrongylus brasiliensis]|nr:hypothetical protein Q1695_016110 [Nippostrongylus brasiliensis]
MAPQIRSERDILDSIEIDCDGLIEGDKEAISIYRNWTFSAEEFERELHESPSRCRTFKELFDFNTVPLSKEEEDYPLAYAMVVYKNVVQSRPPLQWGNFEIINTTYACVEHLYNSKTQWKYFQYLSNFDVPLKTNREMVQIFKQLNGTVNADIEIFPRWRTQRMRRVRPPLPLVKSSLSILLSRSTIDTIVESPFTSQLLRYLTNTFIPDESFWITLAGNPHEFPVPGGFDAKELLKFQRQVIGAGTEVNKQYQTEAYPMNAYISRYQIWQRQKCRGIMYHWSCLFGINVLPTILKQPHLVAHKFYMSYQPAAYFCILKKLRERTYSPTPFDASHYAEIPFVEMSRGVSLQNLTHPEWLLRIY